MYALEKYLLSDIADTCLNKNQGSGSAGLKSMSSWWTKYAD